MIYKLISDILIIPICFVAILMMAALGVLIIMVIDCLIKLWRMG